MLFKALVRFAALFLFVAPAAGPVLARPLSVVVLGDSLVAGYQIAAGDAYPAKLEAALNKDGIAVSITNAGVSGDTTADGAARVDWSVPDGTDAVILELGANDALRGLKPAQTRQNLEAIITRLQERKIAVLLAGMLSPPNMGADYRQEFDAIYPDLAKRYTLPLIGFFLDGVVTHPERQLADGMHPNPSGVDEMVQRTKATVSQFLGEIASRPN